MKIIKIIPIEKMQLSRDFKHRTVWPRKLGGSKHWTWASKFGKFKSTTAL